MLKFGCCGVCTLSDTTIKNEDLTYLWVLSTHVKRRALVIACIELWTRVVLATGHSGYSGLLYFSVITRHSAALSLYNMPPIIFTSRLEL